MEAGSDVGRQRELDLFSVWLLASGLPGLNLIKTVLFLTQGKSKRIVVLFLHLCWMYKTVDASINLLKPSGFFTYHHV